MRGKEAAVERVVMPYVRRYDEQRAAKEKRRAESRVPHWTRSERPGSKEPVRVGFVGAGQYAQHHLAALRSYEAVELAALLTTGGPAAAEVAPLFGGRTFTAPDTFHAQKVDCYVAVVPARVMV